MPNARLIVASAAVAAAALGGCHKQQPQQNQEIAIDSGVPDNAVADNAQVETLPADESSSTPSNQLASGFDNPDVNDVGTANAVNGNSQ
jgi:ABC-type uncharacterized transport system auxiliary subunit